MPPLLLRTAAIAAAWPLAPALAQQPPPTPEVEGTAPAAPTGKQIYEAAYFAPFAPSSALDIVRRVPGFTIQSGDQEVRGFGGAAGNVVINGARPSSKTEPLETILSRIPARRVRRIEIGAGDLFGAEFSGRAQVVNLVLDEAGGLSGTIDASLRRDFSGEIAPQATVSALLRRGPSTFNLSLGYNDRHAPERGPDLISALPSGTLTERREKYNDIHDRLAFAAGSWALEQGENRTAHLNARFAAGEFELNQTNKVFPVGGTARDDSLRQYYRRHEFELGGDITRPFAGGGLRLVGLATRRSRDNRDESFIGVTSAVTSGGVQSTEDVRDERVLRLVWSRSDPNGWSAEAGVEGAFNRLDSNVQLFAVSPGDVRTRVDLPIDQAVVTEYRAEIFYNAGRNLAPNFRVDGGLTLEASRLTVSGDAQAERTLRFLKPRLVLDWRPGDAWHAQLALARTVAQLNFVDFISTAELSNDRVSGGNADLLPQRAWEALATLERPILGDGAIKLELGYQHIELVQDRVPTPQGFDAPGNLGTGRLAFIRGTLDAPLGGLGIRGGRLTVNGTIQDTSVEDPYTRRPRAFSGHNEWALNANFRQDLGKVAWGVSFTGSPTTPFFRRNEIDLIDRLDPFAQMFGEYRLNRRTTFTLTAENIFGVTAHRERYFFRPDRSNPDPYQLEIRDRSFHRAVRLQVRHSFQ